MGERHDDRGHMGRPPVRPGPEMLVADALAAVRPRQLDPEAEARAVAAFRDARRQRQGVRSVRTRRRDDWRPAAARRAVPSLRTLFLALLAGVTVGQVAVASTGHPPHDSPQRPAHSAPPASPGMSGPTSGTNGASRTSELADVSRTSHGKGAQKPAKKTAGAQEKAGNKAEDKTAEASQKAAAESATPVAKSPQGKKK